MTAVHGKGSVVLADEYDLSQYFNQFTASRSVQAVNTTTFVNNGSKAYLAGMEEGSFSIQGLWDGSAAAIDVVLDAAIPSEGIFTFGITGHDAIGDRVVMCKGEHVSYQIRSMANDAVRITVGGTADGGVRTAGVVLQALEAETTTVNNTSHDWGASSAFGGVAHIHVTAFSGTSATVQIQDSDDNNSFSSIAEFTVTGVGAQRSVVSGTVERYTRFAITADNFTSMTICGCFARNRR